MRLPHGKQIFRSLWRHKTFTFINISGLCIGIAAVIIIFLIINYEKSFDAFHKESKNIYRIVTKQEREDKVEYGPATPNPTARFLRQEYVGAVTTQIHLSDDVNVRIGEQEPFEEKYVVFADSLFFNVFDFAGIDKLWISGNPTTALLAPRQAVLTESTAERFFGKTNPIGQIVSLDNKADVQIVGIIKDIPHTSHLPLNMIVSISTLTTEFMGGLDIDSWNFTSNGYTYVRLPDNSSVTAVEQALSSIVIKNATEENERTKKMYLQPLNQIHFDPTFEADNPTYTVSNRYLTMLWLLGGFILLIACVNYINLSSAYAFTKSKEVGVRKTIGASKVQLFIQYMTETAFITCIAAVFGIIMVYLFLPIINSILDKFLSLKQLLNTAFIAYALGMLVSIIFISGAYPALVLAGFNPIYSLKNQVSQPGKHAVLLRKSLVVFQFATSIALIFCTIVIARQMQYFQKKELGFNKDAVVEVQLPESDSAKIQQFRNLLQSGPGIENVSFCLGAPISENGINVELKASQLPSNVEYTVKVIPCDKEYLNAYKLELIAGRWLLPSEEKNIGLAIVINKAMVKTLGFKQPNEALGKTVTLGLNEMKPIIVGVTEDFHTASFHDNIKSVALTPFPYFYYAAGIRVHPNYLNEALGEIEQAWKKVYPENVFKLSFIDEALAQQYKQETKDYNIFKAFSAVSIFICCIGLWGLIAFIIVRKTKEIGIRKVLGSSIKGIVLLLSKDFIKLVSIALLIATPIAWYFMHQWLQGFNYRIAISWWMFLLAGLIAMCIAFLSISFQAIKAALANPVKNLRTE